MASRCTPWTAGSTTPAPRSSGPGVLACSATSPELAGFDRPPAIDRGLAFVPALSGLACPHWDRSAGAMWLGMDAGTRREDLCQALLEGVVLRSAEVIQAMDGYLKVTDRLSIDGGLARSPYFAQFLADSLQRRIVTSASTNSPPSVAPPLPRVASATSWRSAQHPHGVPAAGRRRHRPALAGAFQRSGGAHPRLALSRFQRPGQPVSRSAAGASPLQRGHQPAVLGAHVLAGQQHVDDGFFHRLPPPRRTTARCGRC